MAEINYKMIMSARPVKNRNAPAFDMESPPSRQIISKKPKIANIAPKKIIEKREATPSNDSIKNKSRITIKPMIWYLTIISNVSVKK